MGRNEVLASAILGVWLGVTLFMWFAAGKSFLTVDQILRAPGAQFAKIAQPLTPAATRELLRHLASEINRTFFSAYNWTQVALGLALFFLLLRRTPRDATSLAIAGTMLLFVLILTFIVTPQIVTLGRSLDFVARTPPPPEMSRFRILHGAYTTLDALKLLGGLALLARWVARA